MAWKRKLTGKGTGKAAPKSGIHQQKAVITQSSSRQKSLMSTKKDNNTINIQSSSPKRILSIPNKNDQLEESTKNPNMAMSSLIIGETPVD